MNAWTRHSAWQQLTTPDGNTLWVFRLRGNRPGERESQTVLLTAGIHGDEYEGPVALTAFLNGLHPDDFSGDLIAIPIANPAAFSAGTRTNPADGLNLARCFPGRDGGTPTEQLAAWLFDQFAAPASYAIDLHSGGLAYVFLPLAGFYGEPAPDNAGFQTAREFGLPYVWQLPVTDGVLSCELWKRGAVVIGNEYLGAGQLASDGITAYRTGIGRCLEHWGFLPRRTRPASRVSPVLLTGDWQLSQSDGLYRAHVPLGAHVAAGASIATVIDARGAILQHFCAPNAGVVAALRSNAHIRPGDWAVLVAHARSVK